MNAEAACTEISDERSSLNLKKNNFCEARSRRSLNQFHPVTFV